MGSGVNDSVYALAADGLGNLFAGGRFTVAGGLSASKIAKWSGSEWSALGSGISDPFLCRGSIGRVNGYELAGVGQERGLQKALGQ